MKLWGITHRGAVRQQNQDAYAVRELEDGRGLAVVCDGMGGARAGNVASSMAVELFMRKLEEQGQPGDNPQKWLKTAAAHANDGVFQKAVEDPDCTGMGTTLVAALAGSFTPQQVDRLRDCLAQLEPGPVAQTKPAAYRPAVTARKKAIEQNHLILAFPSLTYLDERRPQLLLLNALLGGGCSSRLFQELREKRGLCYTVYSYVSDHADAGFLGVYAALNREQEGQALDAMRNLVCELADHGPTQEELDRVREQAKANLLMGSESIQSRMSQLGASALLYGRVRETEELLAQYDAVTRQQLRDLAQNIFQMDLASLSAVGRVKTAADYSAWLGR